MTRLALPFALLLGLGLGAGLALGATATASEGALTFKCTAIPIPITNPGKMLSLSFFRDEEAVQQWRQLAEHRRAQAKGRGGVFADYRLRVTQVIRDYGMTERDEAPEDSRRAHGGG